jgi:putative hemolysin
MSAVSLRTLSLVKLQEAFKAIGNEQQADYLVGNREQLILTCRFFGLMSNIGLILVLVSSLIAKGYIVTFIAAAVIGEVFCVAIPHAWAKYTGEISLSRTYRILQILRYSATPVLYLFTVHEKFAKRLAGVTDSSPDQQQEERQEELLSVVEQRKIEGVVDEEEMEMIENVLELADTAVDEIMTPRTDIIALNANEELAEVIETIRNAGHSRIPVYESNIDNIIGLVYAKDLLAEIGRDQGDFKLRDKIRKAYFVPESKPLRVLLHEFQNQKIHIAVVLDEYGGTAGIVTIEDILEELVGEIVDEYEDAPPEAVMHIDENTMEVDARTHIDDLNSDFDFDLPEDESYDTIGGFVFAHLGYIPKTGKVFDYGNITFTITAAETRRIKRVKLQKQLREE